MRPTTAFLALTLAWGLALPVAAQGPPCGIRPIPGAGCRIGDCVEGRWEQICVERPELSPCGPKPIPPYGCLVGACKDDRWEMVCGDITSTFEPPEVSCGLKPIPPAGCRVGDCVDGQWELTCD